MRLVSLSLGGLLADRLGIAAVYLLGGALLALAGALGLALPLDRAPMSSCGGWRWRADGPDNYRPQA